MTTKLSAEDLLRLFREGGPDERRAFVEGCPANPMRAAASSLMSSDDLAPRVMALNMLVQAYGYGQEQALTAALARTGHALGHEVLEAQAEGGALLPCTVSGMAATGLAAMNATGRHDEALALADEWLPYYESIAETTNLPTIHAAKIEALLELMRIDEAWNLLQEVEQRGLHAPDLVRLRGRLEQLRTTATGLAESQPDPGVQIQAGLQGAVDMLAGLTGEAGAGLSELKERLEGLKRNAAEDAEDDGPGGRSHKGLSDVADAITEFMNRHGSGEMNEWTAKKIIRDATAIFLDPVAGNDPERLQASLSELIGVRGWTAEHGTETDDSDALWGMYLCLRRLGRHSEAADALQSLRARTEEQRAGIADPLKRGGVTSKWPYLFEGLTDTLARAGRTEELFDAIEGAKGRAVADQLTQRKGQAVAEAELRPAIDRVRDLLQAAGAHYLTYFVDDDWTLAVLVGKDGSLHQGEHIPVGKAAIREAARFTDPRLWDSHDVADPLAARAPNVSVTLAPLVAWLAPHFESGLIAEGDHVVYSPDEHLHQIPLHYLQLDGEPLVRRVSVSRAHGAHALGVTLGAPAVRPTDALAVVVPTGEDAQRPEMLAALQLAADWLAERLRGARLLREEATLAAIASAELHDRVVHFATHGVFPLEGAAELAPNPFESSGLVLAGPEGLPTDADLNRAIEPEMLLSPARLLELGLGVSHSHVTLQACVTGLAKEGIGGDALGLDWALTQAGAASLLTSHWEVSAELSAEFFARFYERWMGDGRTRAVAWRETVLELLDGEGSVSDPYCWAAFSLSGDFR